MYNEKLRSQKETLLCEDGTNTLYSVEFGEPYHSTKDGALYESLQKHVMPALEIKKHKRELVILDICFGLGYNSFATIYYLLRHNLDTKLHIVSLEFDEKLLHSLDRFEYPPEFDNIRHIIQSVSRNLYYEDKQFKIEILSGDARQSIKKINHKTKIDIVYQDAFSPANNPLLWTKEWFRDVRELCGDDTVLTTYSIAAAVRLGLYENGFYIFVHRAEMMRYSTVASLKMLTTFEYIDMEQKKIRNPDAKSMRDADFIQ